jgi:general secretion pathway protein D
MKRYLIPVALALLGVNSLPLHADSAASDFRKGERAEAHDNLDVAYRAYKAAHEKKPLDPRYMSAYLRVRVFASAAHIQRGQALRDDGRLQDALVEFRLATDEDPSNFASSQELRKTADMIQKQSVASSLTEGQKKQASELEREAQNIAGPQELKLATNTPISIHMTATTDVVYKTLGKIAGLNVLLDPQYKPQKINVELTDVPLGDALKMVAIQSGTFWRVLSPTTILVTSNTAGRRKEFETNVMTTFYLQNVATPTELQDAASSLKSMLDISRVQLSPAERAITVRGTPDQMVLARKLLDSIDKPKPEVMIEVVVLEVARTKIQTLGLNPPTSTTVTLQPSGGSGSGSGSGGFSLNQLAHINANDLTVSIPSVSISALLSDSNTKVIQRPELRAIDSQKATLNIGDRIPIATGSYQSGLTNGVNTQFQYIDVGVNIGITPYIHANNDVTLQMSLEISSVTGEQSVDGVTEPTIGQRRIEHTARLADGEVNLIGGILQDSETNSLSGYPLLSRIPILRYLFGQTNKERAQSEIMIAITPHIIRGVGVTDDDTRVLDIGTADSVSYRAKPDAGSATTDTPAAAPTQGPGRDKQPPPAAPPHAQLAAPPKQQQGQGPAVPN